MADYCSKLFKWACTSCCLSRRVIKSDGVFYVLQRFWGMRGNKSIFWQERVPRTTHRFSVLCWTQRGATLIPSPIPFPTCLPLNWETLSGWLLVPPRPLVEVGGRLFRWWRNRWAGLPGPSGLVSGQTGLPLIFVTLEFKSWGKDTWPPVLCCDGRHWLGLCDFLGNHSCTHRLFFSFYLFCMSARAVPKIPPGTIGAPSIASFSHSERLSRLNRCPHSWITIVAMVPSAWKAHLWSCLETLIEVHLWYTTLIGHDLERHTHVYIRSHSCTSISEQKPSHKVEGTACKVQTGLWRG